MKDEVAVVVGANHIEAVVARGEHIATLEGHALLRFAEGIDMLALAPGQYRRFEVHAHGAVRFMPLHPFGAEPRSAAKVFEQCARRAPHFAGEDPRDEVRILRRALHGGLVEGVEIGIAGVDSGSAFCHGAGSNDRPAAQQPRCGEK